ncbi:15-hydroxyprostaglandin dehydrogenase [Fusarium circinatum]|uniref:15-hydroxyprostaglandin dehydrogenase n=1 Tax=Fusarium circinatum TaxID=48490 RepID=A0A8H5UIH3_FUSCI|nr:15-hydroxyprostaglandin dehydrogenase [Fusarium circinatum]
MLDEDTVLIDPLEVARGMWQLVVNPEYGNGTILEVTKGATRVVPLFNASVPTGEGVMVPGYDASKDALYSDVHQRTWSRACVFFPPLGKPGAEPSQISSQPSLRMDQIKDREQ